MQMLYQAVVEQAIQDWAFGSARHHIEAERFLFHSDEFHTVCQVAGLDVNSLKSRLSKFLPRVRSRYEFQPI